MTRPDPATLPPKTGRDCWAEFLKRTLGIPLICLGALVIIAGAMWLSGGQEMFWQTTSDMGTALFWIGAILVIYPLMLFIWVSDWRKGLRVAAEWAAMDPETQVAALAATKATPASKRPRKGKR